MISNGLIFISLCYNFVSVGIAIPQQRRHSIKINTNNRRVKYLLKGFIDDFPLYTGVENEESTSGKNSLMGYI